MRSQPQQLESKRESNILCNAMWINEINGKLYQQLMAK